MATTANSWCVLLCSTFQTWKWCHPHLGQHVLRIRFWVSCLVTCHQGLAKCAWAARQWQCVIHLKNCQLFCCIPQPFAAGRVREVWVLAPCSSSAVGGTALCWTQADWKDILLLIFKILLGSEELVHLLLAYLWAAQYSLKHCLAIDNTCWVISKPARVFLTYISASICVFYIW